MQTPKPSRSSEKYLADYKMTPDFFASWPYDAVHVLAQAIIMAGSVEPEKIRDALLTVKGYRGVEGTYNFGKNGDGLRGYNIVRNDNGNIVVEKRIDFDN